MRRAALAAACLAAAVASGPSCRKNQRSLRSSALEAARPEAVPVSELRPAGSAPAPDAPNPYEGNAYAISEGQRLYNWYNCSGCHFRGGGGIGPALMDSRWAYGGSPANIFKSIVEGRPNGMPAWGGKIPEYQVWQIVAYVESLDADKSISAPPGPRQDHLQAGEGKKSR